jgi:hypothetical protein
MKGEQVSDSAREQVDALAKQLGWRMVETQDLEGLMATWTLDVWAKGGGEAGDWSVVEVMWTDLGHGPVFKHGLYRSPGSGRRGQLKAVRGQGHRLYWSVEKALSEA